MDYNQARDERSSERATGRREAAAGKTGVGCRPLVGGGCAPTKRPSGRYPHNPLTSTGINKEKKKQKEKVPADDGSIPSVTFLSEWTRGALLRLFFGITLTLSGGRFLSKPRWRPSV